MGPELERHIRHLISNNLDNPLGTAGEQLLKEIDHLRKVVGAGDTAISQLNQQIDAMGDYDQGYESGWQDAAREAIAVCERRKSIEERIMTARNEASKCASQIEWTLLETDPCPYCETKGTVSVNLDHPQTMGCQWCLGAGRVKKTSVLGRLTKLRKTPDSSAGNTHTHR